jgi:WS/DGAT/MGAT family acyltransferase
MIERASSEDLMQLASDLGPFPWQVGALVVLDAGADGDADTGALLDLVALRLASVPRLRQRLVRTPVGCGRPIWVDDPAFDVRRQIRTTTCPAPGDERAALDAAIAVVGRRLPPDRPPWQAVLITGLADHRVGLVVVFHHVLADGIGGLAVLARLTDAAAESEDQAGEVRFRARPAPGRRELARDAWCGRVRALGSARTWPGRLVRALHELNATGATRLPRTSLNRPIGPRRRLTVTRIRLDRVQQVAHRQGASVNDVVVAAIGGALRTLLIDRGEAEPRLVASVPVAVRRSTTADDLGNRLGVMPVELPIDVDPVERLRRVAALTGRRKSDDRGASGGLLAAGFRVMAATGLLRRYVDRQRLVSTFVSNLRGPDRPVTVDGRRVRDLIPLTSITGNVTVSFAVLSYAGTLTVVIVADPDRTPDQDRLAELLGRELEALAAASG